MPIPQPLIVHEIVVGDTLTPLGLTLKQDGSAKNLAGLSVEFHMVDNDGGEVTDWSSTGTTIVSESAGTVQHVFQTAEVANAGIFWAWFRVGTSPSWMTYPAGTPEFDTGAAAYLKARQLQILIRDTA